MKSLRLGEIIHYNEERAYGFIEVEQSSNYQHHPLFREC